VDLFQAQVEKKAENIAVVFEDQQLTYQELNTKANQLAHYLLSLRVICKVYNEVSIFNKGDKIWNLVE